MVLSYSVCLKKKKRKDDREKTIAEKFDKLRTTAIPPDGVVLKKEKRRLNRRSRQLLTEKNVQNVDMSVNRFNSLYVS